MSSGFASISSGVIQWSTKTRTQGHESFTTRECSSVLGGRAPGFRRSRSSSVSCLFSSNRTRYRPTAVARTFRRLRRCT